MRFAALTASVFALSIAAWPVYAEVKHQPAVQSSVVQSASIEVITAWSRELPPSAPVGAAFMTIDNHSDQADRLIGAQSPIAEVAELHAHIHVGDVMRMVKVDAIDIPAHGQLVLEPGSYHVMLINLKKPLVAGQTLPLTVEFERAGQIDITVSIRSSDAGTSAEQPEMDHSAH